MDKLIENFNNSCWNPIKRKYDFKKIWLIERYVLVYKTLKFILTTQENLPRRFRFIIFPPNFTSCLVPLKMDKDTLTSRLLGMARFAFEWKRKRKMVIIYCCSLFRHLPFSPPTTVPKKSELSVSRHVLIYRVIFFASSNVMP